MSRAVVLSSLLWSRRAGRPVLPAPKPPYLHYHHRTSSTSSSQSRSFGGAAAPRGRAAHLAWVGERLGDRDWDVIRTLARFRLASGRQLERLHFTAGLTLKSRPVVRQRVLSRLTSPDWRVLTTFERRIGGVRAGSAGLVFALDKTGHDLMNAAGSRRRPQLPGERFWRHLLDVTELYVQLMERTQISELRLFSFTTEPACWWRDSYGVWLKPDAHLVLEASGVIDDWWVEVDRATESLPTLRRKLTAYVDFARTGQRGPGGVVPRVLVTVPNPKRKRAVQQLINRLSVPAANFIVVEEFEQAAKILIQSLRE